jgi:hypothetical protein
MAETNPIVMSEVTDPIELARERNRWEQADLSQHRCHANADGPDSATQSVSYG